MYPGIPHIEISAEVSRALHQQTALFGVGVFEPKPYFQGSIREKVWGTEGPNEHVHHRERCSVGLL